MHERNDQNEDNQQFAGLTSCLLLMLLLRFERKWNEKLNKFAIELDNTGGQHFVLVRDQVYDWLRKKKTKLFRY